MRRRKFTSEDLVPGVSEKKVIRAAREYVASAFPNPDRIGCPGRQRLAALALQTSVPDADDLYHLMTCSPCFVEYQAIRKARKQKRAVIIGTLVAAGLALIVFCGIIVYRRDPVTPPNSAKKVVEAQKQVLNAIIDLRPFARVRGDSPSHVDSRVSLPVLERGNLLVTIQLPVGSPEGQYVFQLLDSTGSPRVETSGKAAIKNYVTAAEAPFDLRAVSAGRFTLTVRRAVEPESASYAVEVR